MLTLKVLATGSSGNCYLLSTEKETLILDCGIRLKDIKKGLNYDISRIAGVVCSHSHKDHSLSLENFKNMGIKCFAPYEFGDVNTAHVKMGTFDITSFKLPHNGTHNSGFLIVVDDQKLLYMTDLEYCPYTFKKQQVNHILIECNYQEEFIDVLSPNYKHKIKGHCSLDTCKNFVKASATDAIESVVLLHMGLESCYPDECVNEIRKVATKARVEYARKGLEIELKG